MFKYLGNKLRQLFSEKVDEDKLDQMEELFYQADLGARTSQELVKSVRELYRQQPHLSATQILDNIKKELESHLYLYAEPAQHASPHVILIVGVNGNGKTTSLAKLAYFYQKQGSPFY